jgi:hypothetical protein
MASEKENKKAILADRIFSEIMRVFALSRADSEALFQAVSDTGPKEITFWDEILTKLTPPTLVEFPKRPRLDPESNRFAEVYQRFTEKQKTFRETVPTNTTLFVNEGMSILDDEGRFVASVPQGEFGYVKRNRKQPFVYKFSKISTKYTELKLLLLEPVINCILQSDPQAKPFVCQIHRVFCDYDKEDNSFQIIYRIEKLQSTLLDGFTKKIPPSVSEKAAPRDILNYIRMVNIFAPLFQGLLYLENTYSFHHNDLHQNNIMFIKDPDFTDGRIKPIVANNYRVKIIDFGLSELNVLGKRFNGKFSNQLGGATEYTTFLEVLGKGAWYQLKPFRTMSESEIRETIVSEYEDMIKTNENTNNNNKKNSKEGGVRRTRRIRPRLTRKRKY